MRTCFTSYVAVRRASYTSGSTISKTLNFMTVWVKSSTSRSQRTHRTFWLQQRTSTCTFSTKLTRTFLLPEKCTSKTKSRSAWTFSTPIKCSPLTHPPKTCIQYKFRSSSTRTCKNKARKSTYQKWKSCTPQLQSTATRSNSPIKRDRRAFRLCRGRKARYTQKATLEGN